MRKQTNKKKTISINPFFQGPIKLNNGSSMINHLKTQYGKRVGKVYTFQTESITTKTLSNRLILNGDTVYLQINKTIIPCWDIKDIVLSMKRKNDNKRTITKNYVSSLLLEGKLRVKFNVSEIKDHGTLWSIVK